VEHLPEQQVRQVLADRQETLLVELPALLREELAAIPVAPVVKLVPQALVEPAVARV
jgi:hypothetical protein